MITQQQVHESAREQLIAKALRLRFAAYRCGELETKSLYLMLAAGCSLGVSATLWVAATLKAFTAPHRAAGLTTATDIQEQGGYKTGPTYMHIWQVAPPVQICNTHRVHWSHQSQRPGL
jgi:hypothetical protein